MKAGTKIFIGVGITLFLIVGLVVGGVVAFFWRADYVRKRNIARVKQARIDGREFAKTTDQNDCMEKGFTFSNDSSFFMSGCLRTSRPTPDFCQGVPFWEPKLAEEQCKKFGGNKDSCIQAFQAKPSFCRYEAGE